MTPSDREGTKALAQYLRVVREARWEGLPPEAAAEEAWPYFQKAVAAALREARALAGVSLPLAGALQLKSDAYAHSSPKSDSIA